MSEAEIISELGFRAELNWNLLQWWVSVSFAAMMAAYFGSQKLTKPIVALIIGIYFLTTVRVILAVGNHGFYIQDLYMALQSLSDLGEMSAVGAGALDRSVENSVQGWFGPIWVVLSFVFTNGFVIYCYKFVKKPE